jgi:hypothetical protein
MCLNETCSTNHIGNYLSDAFLVQNDLKQGVLSPLLFLSICDQDGQRKCRGWN